jgi:2-iminobutanoate/2-iminopropanoate deaminase
LALRRIGSNSRVGSPPYSRAVVAAPLVFVSGQVGRDPGTGVVAEGIRDQTTNALRNVETTLEEVGLDRSTIVRTTVYLVEASAFDAMNDAYRAFFGAELPARTTIVAGLAAEGLLIEIDAIAYSQSIP